MTQNIKHVPASHRFELSAAGTLAEVTYRIDGEVMTILHTEVPEALAGRGIAGTLVRTALDHARANGMKVRPECTYAKSYMERHPETMALHV